MIAHNALKKAAIIPKTKTGASAATSSNSRCLYKSYTLAATNVGIAKKNENSVAAWRDKPNNKPPIIVAPERDVPGINAKA